MPIVKRRREEMSERVMEIVAYIVDAMQSDLDEAIFGQFEDLSTLLIEQGYLQFSLFMAHRENPPRYG